MRNTEFRPLITTSDENCPENANPATCSLCRYLRKNQATINREPVIYINKLKSTEYKKLINEITKMREICKKCRIRNNKTR
ncbi:MAG: hypothetical protein J6W79_01495 [Alphaproteobacteria bacterium]|nr:hypothetical protein [Alphaproteobacteria bacterium]